MKTINRRELLNTIRQLNQVVEKLVQKKLNPVGLTNNKLLKVFFEYMDFIAQDKEVLKNVPKSVIMYYNEFIETVESLPDEELPKPKEDPIEQDLKDLQELDEPKPKLKRGRPPNKNKNKGRPKIKKPKPERLTITRKVFEIMKEKGWTKSGRTIAQIMKRDYPDLFKDVSEQYLYLCSLRLTRGDVPKGKYK